MDPAKLKLYQQVIRLAKGIIKAFEDWLETEVGRKGKEL